MDRLTLRTEDGVELEAELRASDGPARAGAVLCHPHPRHGGSKDHPLLWAIRNGLAARGFAVLSFNFRGVMGSGGEYAGGEGELADVRAAVERAQGETAADVFVCGWSFGANVALREAVDDARVGALALLGMPLADTSVALPPLPARPTLRAFERPVLLLSGAADPFCPVPELQLLGRRLGHARVEIVPGTDHFFWRREREAAALVAAFAEEDFLAAR